MTIFDFFNKVKLELNGLYDSGEIKALVNYLMQERLQMSFHDLLVRDKEVIPEKMVSVLLSDLNRMKTGEPIQHIIGFAWFNDLKILVDRNVLIPRPETEEMVSFIEDQFFKDDAVFFDICTGSGCIALALKKHFPGAFVYGADVSSEALEIASKNSDQLNLPVSWIKWDLLNEPDPQSEIPELDLIVSNPPYICMDEFNSMHKNVTDFEPHLALFVPDDDPLIFYKEILKFSIRKLKNGGRIWVELNRAFAEDVAELFENAGFCDVRIYRDTSANDRFVSAVKWS